MANFLITTPGQVTRGTTNADTIVYGPAGVSASTVIGNMGADTVTINGTGANFQSVDFMMNNGHDKLVIDFTEHDISSSNFFGGGKGNDVISLTDNFTDEGETVASGSEDVSVFVAKGGSGRDTITVTGIHGSQISIGGNAGHDSITYAGSADKSYVGGGKGNDTITLSGTFQGGIYGGLLDDQINAAAISATVLNGDSGNDKITVSAVVFSGTFINGNAGNDTISVGSLAGDNTVAGGNNADVITVSAVGTGMVAGGKGHDDITVSGALTTTVYGGAGADTIDLGSTGADDAVLKVNAGDSTVGTMDIVSGGFATVNAYVTAVVASAVTIERTGITQLEISQGVIASGDFALASGMGITATVAQIDKLSELSKGGNTVVFNKGDNAYLFIQGGTVGSTADDTVVKFANATGIAVRTDGKQVSIFNSGQAVPV